jgi:hypothetical protein
MLSVQERLGVATEPIAGAAWQWACMLRCAMPGIVMSFDSEKQTCVVQPAIQEMVLLAPPATTQNPNPGTTQNIPTSVTIKPLQDVPIMMMRVMGWSMTFPITEGTECLLIFADSCIDGWWQNSGVNPQYDRRRHDLSDAFALFGPWSQPNNIPNYSTNSVQIRNDDQSVVIELANGEITVKAPTVNVQSTTANIEGDTVNVTGNNTVNISGNGTTHIDGKDFLLHTHTGGTIMPGGVTGPVI